MALPASVFEQVRQRANYQCEYCCVTETAARGVLTIDHYRPTKHDGSDDPANLIYACVRCNQHKADYLPTGDDGIPLWNPRQDSGSTHFFELEDGHLLAITETGRETIARLRLNRAPLVNARLAEIEERTYSALIVRSIEVASQLASINASRADVSAEETTLLTELQSVLEALSKRG